MAPQGHLVAFAAGLLAAKVDPQSAAARWLNDAMNSRACT
jgi:hypothetical protein